MTHHIIIIIIIIGHVTGQYIRRTPTVLWVTCRSVLAREELPRVRGSDFEVPLTCVRTE